MARFANGKAPFLRKTDSGKFGTGIVMRDFLIGLLPIILFAWYKNGLSVYLAGEITLLESFYPLVFIFLGGFISLVLEGLYFVVTDKEVRTLKALAKKFSVSYSMIPGLLLAMILPLYTPIWVLIFGCLMGTLVAKMLFGGFGYNIFNPALVGYVAIAFTLSGVIKDAGGALNASEVLALDAIGGATPLSRLDALHQISYAQLVAPYGSLWDFFLGTIPGALAETGTLAILIAYVWYSVRGVIKWFTPLIYVGTVFVLSWILGAVNGETGIWFPLYSVLSGGLVFGAVLMATEPVTTPKNPLGKVFFALFLGVFTVLFRFVGNLPEGVATSILFMNIFTMPVDKWTAVIRQEGLSKKNPIIKFAVLVVLLVLLAAFAIFRGAGIYSTILPIGGLF